MCHIGIFGGGLPQSPSGTWKVFEIQLREGWCSRNAKCPADSTVPITVRAHLSPSAVLRIQGLEVKQVNFELILLCLCWVQKVWHTWKLKVINHIQCLSCFRKHIRRIEHGNIKDYCLSLGPKAPMVGVVRVGNKKARKLGSQWEVRAVILGEHFCIKPSEQWRKPGIDHDTCKVKVKVTGVNASCWMSSMWALKDPGIKEKESDQYVRGRSL